MATEALAVLSSVEEALSGWICPSTAGCCHFERTGREPSVTEAEWELLEREIARQGRKCSSLRTDGACPFLSPEDRCLVYAVRPLGCRTYYCHLATGPSAIPRFTPAIQQLETSSSSRAQPLRWWVRSKLGFRRSRRDRRSRGSAG
jgi:Fe-S-cluster containining protein